MSYAALRLPPNSVGTRQIKDHAVTWAKIDTNVRHAVRQTPGPQGVAGPAGPRGATGPIGPQGEPGTARAYGEVDPNGELSSSKGSESVTHPQAGRYCLTVPGVDPSAVTIAITLNVLSAPNTAPPAERAGDGSVCPSGTWEIATGTLRAPAGGGSVQFTNADEPFSFVVP